MKTTVGLLILLAALFVGRYYGMHSKAKPAPPIVVVEPKQPQPEDGSGMYGGLGTRMGSAIVYDAMKRFARDDLKWTDAEIAQVGDRFLLGTGIRKQPKFSGASPIAPNDLEASILRAIDPSKPIAEPSKPKLYFFTASWCGPCQSIKAKMAKRNFADFDVVTVDVDQHGADRSLMKGNTIPQLVIVQGDKTWRFVGPGKIAGWLK